MMSKYYILEGKNPVPVKDVLAWGMQSLDRSSWSVDKTDIGDVLVSTVFLGIDHSMSFNNPGVPILFETMVFGGIYNEYQWRYATWEEAEKGHKKACDVVLESFPLKEEALKKVIIESLN